MRLFIGLVTEDAGLRRNFEQDGTVPRDSLNRGFFRNRPAQVSAAAWKPEGVPCRRKLETFFLDNVGNAEACILVVDRRWRDYVADIRAPVFVIEFDAPHVTPNYRNFFHGILGRALRSFGQLLAKFERGDDFKLLVLPLRNFHAAELTELARLCREDYQSPDFDRDVEARLAELRARVRPRRRTSYRTTYAVDDKQRFFHYGLERHARFPTGDPHLTYCEIAGMFRFGRRVDELRHFNVSETEGDETTIVGRFADCHGEEHDVTDGTHLNMFCNDSF